ncbi:MAG: hypothetical protein EPO65_02230 [Dehalococcoidia bacterium]|nr:MAG: hypothetical protein EPO65_02230 [Dehalococcoidia bacterium]
MSKFRQLIRETGKTPAGFGFAALSKSTKARHILVLAEAANSAAATAAAEAGVDAVVFTGAASEVGAIATAAGKPTGAWLLDADKASVQAARDAGADFFVFDDGRAHASSMAVDEIGRVLVLGADQDEQRLRSIAVIDLDAVLITGDSSAQTVRDLLALRRVVGYTGAPLLVASEQVPTAATLEAWRDAGAAAVLVRGDAGALKATVEAAGAVPAPKKRRTEGPTASLGLHSTASAGHDHDHDDEDDV